MYAIAQYTLYFLFYSFLGAVIETLYRLITQGHLYGIHGFLHLPIFPIYGFGAVLIVILSKTRFRHPVWLFVMGVVLATILEFAASWLIQTIFGVKIWDYSQDPFNLYGRVSLESSIGFGIAALAVIYFIHPLLSRFIKHISKPATIATAIVIWIVLIIETVISTVGYLVK